MTVYEGRDGLKKLRKAAHKGMELYAVLKEYGSNDYSHQYSRYVLDNVSFGGEWQSTTGVTIHQMLSRGPVHDVPPIGMRNLNAPNVQGSDFNMVRGGTWNEQLEWTDKQGRLATERRKRGF